MQAKPFSPVTTLVEAQASPLPPAAPTRSMGLRPDSTPAIPAMWLLSGTLAEVNGSGFGQARQLRRHVRYGESGHLADSPTEFVVLPTQPSNAVNSQRLYA